MILLVIDTIHIITYTVTRESNLVRVLLLFWSLTFIRQKVKYYLISYLIHVPEKGIKQA